MPLDPDTAHDIEKTFGRQLVAIRAVWSREGKLRGLEAQYSEKFERSAGGRYLYGGTRTVWEPVENVVRD